MFASLPESYIDTLIDNAEKSPHAQLHVYDDIYKYIQEFAHKYPILVSGEPTGATRVFKMYGPYIFQHANNLANELTKFTPYVRLNTNVRNKEFTIVVDGARMVYLYNIETSIMEIMKGAAKGDLSILSPEVELIHVYHQLYSPHVYCKWHVLFPHEECLWKQFSNTRSRVISKPIVKGGGEHAQVVLQWLKDQQGYVVIGDTAVSILSDNARVHFSTIQIIAVNTEHIIKGLTLHMKKYTGGNISVKKYDGNLPDDYRIRKYVISTIVNKITYYIATIFNSASYELIPYTCVAGVNVGVNTVLLRFMFADIWFLRVLRYFNIINQKKYKKNMSMLYNNIDIVHRKWINDSQNKDVPMYIGTYINEASSKKNEDMIFPYYPAKTKNDTGKFRVIGTTPTN
jgi:hypothetical protein